MTLEERRNPSDQVELFKISKGLSAIPRNSFFRADNSERTRGHSMNLAKDRFRDVPDHQSKLPRKNTLFTKIIVHFYQHIICLCSGFNFSPDFGFRIIPDSQNPVGIPDFRNSCCIPRKIQA